MSKVVVFGANGGTGRLIVEQARQAGHDVTAAVRRPTGPGEIAADVRDAESVAAAVTGQDVVISAIGAPGRKSLNLYSDAARAFIAAMDHGRLIVITSSGVRPDDPNFSLWYRVLAHTLVKELYADMRHGEEIIRESALDWTFVRPTRLLDTPAAESIRAENAQTPKGGWQIPRANVARFIVTELEDSRWSHQAPTLAL
ncbi:NAD(P)H-binding protein [Kribbella sp. NPDC005582]|uniref:NAD(P)-dependent oxidoreductase n=1 Tax=Kribbella sp. NPDC005582 TaxID=3156893 RepID=UPI0033B8ED44